MPRAELISDGKTKTPNCPVASNCFPNSSELETRETRYRLEIVTSWSGEQRQRAYDTRGIQVRLRCPIGG